MNTRKSVAFARHREIQGLCKTTHSSGILPDHDGRVVRGPMKKRTNSRRARSSEQSLPPADQHPSDNVRSPGGNLTADRRAGDERLRRRETRWHSALEHLAEGVIVASETGE